MIAVGRAVAKLRHVCRDVIRPRRVESELDEELDAYVDLLAAEKAAAGMSADDARRAAVADLGARERIKMLVRSQRFPVARTAYAFAVLTMTVGLGVAANVGLFAIQRSVIVASARHAQAARPSAVVVRPAVTAATALRAQASTAHDSTPNTRVAARARSDSANDRVGSQAVATERTVLPTVVSPP